ncbi:MAG: PaaI family thioesterase [Vicinamibacteria bacterium]|nr:PaaI family thioesterase [Vicinamibacteria bacterium]
MREVKASRLRQSFEQQAFLKTLGARLTRVTRGKVAIRIEVASPITQQHGFVHAGVVSALADTAAGYAAMTLLADHAEVVTAEFKINFLKPALGKALVAEAQVIRSGRTLSVSRAEVFTVTGSARSHVATLLATIAHLPGPGETAKGRVRT